MNLWYTLDTRGMDTFEVSMRLVLTTFCGVWSFVVTLGILRIVTGVTL